MSTSVGQCRFLSQAGLLVLFFALGLRPGRAPAQDFPQEHALPAGLAKFVPADAGLFLEFDHLTQALRRYEAGPLHDRLKTFPAWSEWIKTESQGIHAVTENFAAAFGVPWETLTDDVIDGRLALAIWPKQQSTANGAAPRRYASGGTLLIIEAKNAENLAKVARGFRSLQSSAGVNWQQSTIGDATVYTGAPDKNKPGQTYILAQLDSTAILTDRSDLLADVLALFSGQATAETSSPLADSPEFRESLKAFPETADAFLYLNAPVWQAVLAEQATSPQGAEPSPEILRRQAVARVLHAMKFGAMTLRVGDRFELNEVLQFDTGKLSPGTREFLQSASGESAMLASIPEDCLAAAAVRLDLTQLPGWTDNNQSSAFLTRISASLGPEFGAHLAAVGPPTRLEGKAALGDVAGDQVAEDQTGESSDSFPLAWVFGIQLRSALKSVTLADLNSMLKDAMPEIMNIAYRTTASPFLSNLHTLLDQGAELSSLQEWTLFTAGSATSFGFKDGYAVASSSARAVDQFSRDKSTPGLVKNPRIRELLERPVLRGLPNQVLYLNCARLRELLADRAGEIASAIEGAQNVTRDEAKLAIGQMIDVLRLADDIVVGARITPDRVATSIVISADQD